VRQIMPVFQKRLRALASHPLIGEADGVGLIGAVEIVSDKAAKKNFPAEKMVAAACTRFAEEEGLLVRALLGDRIAFCPPLVITEAEIGEMFDRFTRALDKTEAWVRKEGLR
jgi:4-aminobutyrate--pyruvate transaminase